MKKISLLVAIIFTILVLYFVNQKNSAVEPSSKDGGLENTVLPATTTEAKSKIYQSPIGIDYLRAIKIDTQPVVIENELAPGSNYKRYYASYLSEGYKVYGLLTIPNSPQPEDGFPAIVFNHGYIPPAQYTTEGYYVAYVDALARNNFVVFKIDFRGNAKSEGVSSGTYFSSSYMIDALSALRALQKYEAVDPKRIGMWGHSMSGNLLLRAMLVSDDVKAGVIWAGAVYSYADFGKYGISDSSYRGAPRQGIPRVVVPDKNRETSEEVQKVRSDPDSIDFSSDFWRAISLTSNIKYLTKPIQLHHSVNDDVVNINYSRELAKVLAENNKEHEIYEYAGGGHNITSPYFDVAMQRTVDFFIKHL